MPSAFLFFKIITSLILELIKMRPVKTRVEIVFRVAIILLVFVIGLTFFLKISTYNDYFGFWFTIVFLVLQDSVFFYVKES